MESAGKGSDSGKPGPTGEPARAQPTAVVPRASATVMLVRDGASAPEVLMLRRMPKAGDRHAGAYVFPGGIVDPGDRQVEDCCSGLSDAAASDRLGVAAGGLAFYVAAIRECFEEAGVLLARRTDNGEVVALDELPAGRVVELRSALRDGRASVADVCEQLGVRLAADLLAYHSHWLTPTGLPKRFDTRFFVSALPAGQSAASQSEETHEHLWLTAADALAARNAEPLPAPTRHSLMDVRRFNTVGAFMDATRSLTNITRVLPVMANNLRGMAPVHPSHAAYAEVARIDPHGHGLAWSILRPEQAVRLSADIVRVTAASDVGVVTHVNTDPRAGPDSQRGADAQPGPNSYIVGHAAARRWAVIDPGHADAAHIAALIDAAPGLVTHILLTHDDAANSAAAVALRDRTGARLVGPIGDADNTHAPADGEVLAVGEGVELVATPSSDRKQVCYLLASESTLFTGNLAERPARSGGAHVSWLAPGRGFLVKLADK
ncbi:hypothetical protein BH09PSE5_BH09PSE5_37230 [soil metagenome]